MSTLPTIAIIFANTALFIGIVVVVISNSRLKADVDEYRKIADDLMFDLVKTQRALIRAQPLRGKGGRFVSRRSGSAGAGAGVSREWCVAATYVGEPLRGPHSASEREVSYYPCTCHPDDRPPGPCQGRYAASECAAAYAVATDPDAGCSSTTPTPERTGGSR